MFLIRVLVTILALIFTLAGYDSSKNFELVGGLVVFFWSIPILIFVTLLAAVEKLMGKMGPFVIALIGLAPYFLLLTAKGDRAYPGAITYTGLAWSAFWVLTYYGSPARLAIRKPPADRRRRAERAPATCSNTAPGQNNVPRNKKVRPR